MTAARRGARRAWIAGPLTCLLVGLAGCGGADVDPQRDYLASVEPQLQRLARSAVLTQKVLARVTSPNQLPAAQSVVARQLDLVDEVKIALDGTKPADQGAQPAFNHVTTAVAVHRRYMVQLSRALAVSDGSAAATVDLTEDLARATSRAYERASTDGSVAAQQIAAAELADVSGVRTALRRQAAQAAARQEAVRVAAAEQAAREAAARSAAAQAAADAQGNGETPPSMSEARAMTEQAFIFTRDGRYAEAEALSQRALLALAGTGDPREGNAYYNLGLSILRQGRCREALAPLGTSLESGTDQQQGTRLAAYQEALDCS